MSTHQTNFCNNMLEDTSKPTNNKLQDSSKPTNDIGQELHGEASQQSPKHELHEQEEIFDNEQELHGDGTKDASQQPPKDDLQEQVEETVDNEKELHGTKHASHQPPKDDMHEQVESMDADEEVLEAVNNEQVGGVQSEQMGSMDPDHVQALEASEEGQVECLHDEQEESMDADRAQVEEAGSNDEVEIENYYLVEMMDDEQLEADDEPTFENTEDVTSTDGTDNDDQESAATMLPYDQQTPEEPQVTFEIGGAASIPVTPLHSSPSVDSALAGKSSPQFSANAVDSPEEDCIQCSLNSHLEQVPFSVILGNEPKAPPPSGIQQARPNQHFQQMLLSQQIFMAEENNSTSNRSMGDQVPMRRNLGSGSTEPTGSNAYGLPTSNHGLHQMPHNISTSQIMPQVPMNQHESAAAANLFGQQEIQYQSLVQSQGAESGFYPTIGSNLNQAVQLGNIPPTQQQGMPGNFLSGNPYQVGELPRHPRMTMNNWQENLTSPSPSWLHQGQASPGLQNYAGNNIPNPQNPRPRPLKNSLYDPMYEAMGLPIDPHLRAFLGMQRRNNNGGNDAA